MNTVLLHTCCAPCSVYCVDSLRAEGIEPTALWYNPNIHPYQEYVARRDTLMWYAPSIGMELKVIEEYGLRDFVRAVADDIPHRCTHCYAIRMDRTARYAAEHGFSSFSTTLLVSPYQNHAGIIAAAEAAAAKYGVEFLYRDFRVGFREGQAKARELEMYMQKYCGCIFSEEDRYQKKIQKDLLRNEA
ncbi:MAG: epoxyqueuosine reductase QueH [Oscillospiraceae bacterium]|nr:epoxyqueuosine reductase QueH [Oscillospiraceae bacterium]